MLRHMDRATGKMVGIDGSAISSMTGQLLTSAEIEEGWGLSCGALDPEFDAEEDAAREMYSQPVCTGSDPAAARSQTSMTLSRQERHCSTFSSSSSSSPTTTSSDNETREREDRTESDTSPVPVSTNVDDRMGQPVVDQANQNLPKTNKKETMIERGSPLSDDSGRASSEVPEWLQEFRENLVDDEIPERRDSHASSSHEVSLEPIFKRRVDLGMHSVYTHFPKDRNCEICQRTKITRAPCRRRNGGAVPRAENFGDLITADHKVLSESCESRNSHRFAVVVQDLATQWIQSYPCKTKTSQDTPRSLQKFLEPDRKPKVIYTDNSFVKIFPEIIARLHHTDRKQMGLLQEQCAE